MFSVGGFLEFRTKQKKTGTISLWPSSVQQMAVSDQESGGPDKKKCSPIKRGLPLGVCKETGNVVCCVQGSMALPDLRPPASGTEMRHVCLRRLVCGPLLWPL